MPNIKRILIYPLLVFLFYSFASSSCASDTGDFIVSGGKLGYDYEFISWTETDHGDLNQMLIINTSTPLTISTRRALKNAFIRVESYDGNANLVLNNVYIDNQSMMNYESLPSPLGILDTNTTLTLAEDSFNYFRGGSPAEGIFIDDHSHLTIMGRGSLEAIGGTASHGIGCIQNESLPNAPTGMPVTILDGTILASGPIGAFSNQPDISKYTKPVFFTKTVSNVAEELSVLNYKCKEIFLSSYASGKTYLNAHHTYERTITWPTCEKEGEEVFTCKYCHNSYKNILSAYGHLWGNGIVTTEPAINQCGIRTYYCSRSDCLAQSTQSIPALTPTNTQKTEVNSSYSNTANTNTLNTNTLNTNSLNSNTPDRNTNSSVSQGTTSTSINVKVPAVTIKSLTAKKGKKIVVKWKISKNVHGYQIQLSTKSNFPKSKRKTKTIKGKAKSYVTISGLKKNTKYYFRIRTYKIVKGKYYYSSWSKKKSKKTLKK